MNLIVNTSKNWGIGKDGALLKYLKPDMKRFREITTGGVVIMGRKTLETFPDRKPLKNRLNIVITRNPAYTCDGAVICHSPEEAMEAAGGYDTDSVFIIGGSSVYTWFLPYCRNALVTRMEAHMDADKFFPNLDAEPAWELVENGGMQEYEGLKFRYTRYENRDIREV